MIKQFNLNFNQLKYLNISEIVIYLMFIDKFKVIYSREYFILYKYMMNKKYCIVTFEFFHC